MHQEGRLAASYLIEQKIENIIFAGYPPPREMDWLSQRFDGVKAVCREKSANIDSIKMESSDIRAFNEIEKRIREASSKTALCIPTDAFAIPLIEYLKRKNMFAGKDYSLITFGNSSRGAKRLKLTTVIRPEETVTKALIYLCVREKFSLPTEGKIVCRLRSRIIERDSVLRAGNENGQTKG
jgi:DNA-binding LacI/PurR family transcriptional regulator